jgi:hypothetical protein
MERGKLCFFIKTPKKNFPLAKKRGKNPKSRVTVLFPPPFCEVAVNGMRVGDLTLLFPELQLRNSTGLIRMGCTGFAIMPFPPRRIGRLHVNI